MLQFIREKSQGVVAIVIIGILVLSFALWGIHNYFNNGGQQAPVVKVNGQKISQGDLSMALERAQNQARQMGYQINTQAQLNQLKHQVIQNLVMMNLLHQSALHEGFAVSPTLLDLTLARIPMFHDANGGFDKEKFLRMVSAMGYQPEQFYAMMTSNLLLQQAQNGIAENAIVLPYMTKRTMALLYQSRSFAYALLKASDFASKVRVTHKQMTAYYKAHQDEFTVPQQIQLQYIRLSLSDLEKGLSPSDKDLHAFYQDNIKLFSVPAQWKVGQIFLPLAMDASDKTMLKVAKAARRIESAIHQNPASFAQYAKQYPPQMPMGKGGWVSLLEMPQPMQLEMMKMKKVGDISSPVKLETGYLIVKVDQIKAAKVHPYGQVEARVRQAYMQQTAQKQFSSESDRLSSLTFEHPDSLKTAAKALGETIQTSPVFSKDGAKGLFAKPAVLNAAFSDDVLNGGNNSQMVSLDDGSVMVLRVAKKIPSKQKPFAAVSSDIHDQLVKQQAIMLAHQAAVKIGAAVTNLAALNKAASVAGVSVKQVQNFQLHKPDKSVSPLMVQKVFNMPRPYGNVYPHAVLQLPTGDSAVVLLTGVEDGKPNLNAKEQAAFAQSLQASRGKMDYMLYMVGLKQAAKIKYYSHQ